ncbi:receptor-type tyrosine-protein kinase FLT3-like [Chrysoperla carnea]|uniref:receptor-type tyrosine-protein kinase FLT3-like n=1 Tax=Chrysoperla carnea TaxID=189513 RepID=UPI001D096444|nr:receptor-type tyrosine-protein kinase FLT3-like [Chrysoperla carnea]
MQVTWKGQWKSIYFMFLSIVSINLKYSVASNNTAILLNSQIQNSSNLSDHTDLNILLNQIVKTKNPTIRRIKRNIGPPRNLTGFVFWDDSLNIFRLKLTWLPPENMLKSYGYNLTYFCDPRPCKSGYNSEADLLHKDIKSITIPTSEEKDFISLNSTIHIVLTSLPNSSKENNSITFIYNVPDCVDNRCYCGHMNNLPKPKIQAVFTHNGKVNVSWSTPYKILEKNDSRYHTIHVYMSVIIFCTIILIRQKVKTWLKYVCIEKSHNNKRSSTDFNTSNEGYFRLTKLNSSTIPLKKSEVYVDHKNEDCCEIAFTRLTFQNQIGRGEFGLVHRAYLNSSESNKERLTVAVKTLKEHATPDEMNDFIKEITMFKYLGYHPNIVKLIGYCTTQQPLCMIMEYLANGDLATYLRKLKENWRNAQNKFPLRFQTNKINHFNFSNTDIDKIAKYSTGSISSTFTFDSTITTSMATSRSGRPSATETEYILLSSDGSLLTTPNSATESPIIIENIVNSIELQKFASQIALGMAYLEEKNITHRDLAARNILIDDNKNLKISDFGLSRSGTYICTKSKLPYRWLSIEALKDQIFTNKSDVWSFGIVLWEIGTLGDFPYSSLDNYMQILKYLSDGNRLEKPNSLSDDIYNLMLRCWAENPDNRPTFAEITDDLNAMSDKKLYITFDSLKLDYFLEYSQV